jgi:hypothetical protein
VLNLKSEFRKKLLTIAGYKCYNIHLSDYYNEDVNMIEEIYNIVESSGKKKKEIKKLESSNIN